MSIELKIIINKYSKKKSPELYLRLKLLKLVGTLSMHMQFRWILLHFENGLPLTVAVPQSLNVVQVEYGLWMLTYDAPNILDFNEFPATSLYSTVDNLPSTLSY